MVALYFCACTRTDWLGFEDCLNSEQRTSGIWKIKNTWTTRRVEREERASNQKVEHATQLLLQATEEGNV